MNELKSYQKCPQCAGNGKYTESGINGSVTTDPCDVCGGSGFVQIGRVDGATQFADIIDKLNDIKEKVDEIKAKVDTL